MKICVLVALTTALTVSGNPSQEVRVTIVNRAGQPLAGLRVYPGFYDPNGLEQWESHTTNAKGEVRPEYSADVYIAIAKDGQMAVSRSSQVQFGDQGTITVRVVDPADKPVKGRIVFLQPAKEPAPPLRSSQFICGLTKAPPAEIAAQWLRTTDARGQVAFDHVPVGFPFWVYAGLPSGNLVRFDGTALAGFQHRVVMSHACVLTGRVLDEHGRPVKRASIELGNTDYIVGPLDNAMTVYARGHTNADGRFRIPNLVNASYEVEVVLPRNDSREIALVNGVKPKNGAWVYVELHPGVNRGDLRLAKRRQY
jgi:hypothetical protein